MKFIKGLFKDTGLVDQPEGSWRHSKNILMNKTKMRNTIITRIVLRTILGDLIAGYAQH